MASPDRIIYEFGNFRLIPGEGLLLQNGQQVALSLKAFSTLVLLVGRHGHLVGKSELIETVWKDAFVEESAVSRCVWTIRNALGEDSKSGTFIQTIPRRGYRFVGPVSILNDASEFLSKPTELISTGFRLPVLPENENGGPELVLPSESPRRNGGPIAVPSADPPHSRTFPRWAVYLGLAVMIGGVALYFTFANWSTLGKGGTRRIAVLPLKPLDLEVRDPIYDLGIAEALISKLGKEKKLSVRQLDAVRRYADINVDPMTAGKEQSVDYVLSSHYQLAGGKMKVTAQLIDVATGRTQENYAATAELADLFSAQDAIANNIGNKLLARFGSDATEFRSNRGTSNEEAYRNYQQAMTLLDQQRPGSIEKAREYLDHAVELDPNYARAWAGKAYAYSIIWSAGRPSDPEDLPEKYKRSMGAAERALAIDPNLSEAYTSLCENKFAYEFNFDEAEKDCKQAIDLDPNSPLAHSLYSMLLTSRGRSDESFTEIKTAMELEPVSLRNQRVFANALYYARRYGEAIEVYKRLYDLNPDASATHLYLIRALERSGRESEAFDFLISLLVLQKKDDATIERFRAAYASSGWRGVLSERIKTELQEKSPQYSVVAEHYGLLGDKDKAFEYLEKNLPKRHWMKMFYRVDPRFDPLRDDPRFDAMVQRVEAK